MASLALRRTLTGYVPADAPSEGEWRKHKVGQVYRAKVTKPRDYTNHCRFMCLLELTYENQERYVNDRLFRRAVAYEAGHCEEFMTMDGEILRYPLPYDYEHIPDEDDFVKAFGAAMTVCAAILRMTAPALEEEVSRYANENYGIDCPRIFREGAKEQAA